MSRCEGLLVCLCIMFLIAGCTSAQPQAQASAQTPSEMQKREPEKPPVPDPRIEQVKSMCPEAEESDLPAFVRVKELADNGRAGYEKYMTQRIKTGSGDSVTLSEAVSSYSEADKLVRALLAKYPHSEFLSTLSSRIREDMRVLEMEKK